MQPVLGPPREALAESAVLEALSLRRGARVRHGCDVLSATGAETGTLLPFTGGRVSWSYRAPDRVTGQSDAVAAVRRQAALELAGPVSVNLSAVLLRLWTELQLLTGGWARFYLGVFTVTNPGALTDDGVLLTRTLQLADKSYRWANAVLTEPLVVPAGTAVVPYVTADLASRFGETVHAVPGSTATLALGMTYETGTSWLEVYSSLLEAVGYDQLTASESGRPSSRPLAELASRAPEVLYGAGAGKVVAAGSVEPLLPSLPNVVRFSARQGPSLGNVEGNGLRTVRNQSTGPASIDARGGVEVELRVDVDADTQAALDAIAAADAGRYFAGGGLRWQGKVGLNPRHSDRDVIALSLPRLGLTDPVGATAWLVTSWTYPLQPVQSGEGAALMDVTAERRVG